MIAYNCFGGRDSRYKETDPPINKTLPQYLKVFVSFLHTKWLQYCLYLVLFTFASLGHFINLPSTRYFINYVASLSHRWLVDAVGILEIIGLQRYNLAIICMVYEF